MRKILLVIIIFLMHFSAEAQYNYTLLGQKSVDNNTYANIWGYTQNNKEYALLACGGSNTLNDACAIIDVTNPANPNTLFRVQGPPSLWREIRTWQHYAYITTEASDNTFGITIVDLQYLPDSIKSKQYTANGLISNVHALHIDDGYLYLYGANNQLSQGGALILDLADPWNPTVAGAYSEQYVHDGIVRNNKMYSGEIFNGTFSIVDVTNKANPTVIETQITPSAFTHNTWLSTDNQVLYTTDEKRDAFVTSYNISNPTNIVELDRYKRQASNGAIPHNTYVLRDSLVTGSNTDFVHTSYYTEGVTIVDAARPDNLVEVAHYDTSPFSGEAFKGAWGVYPYLPSGNILVSDMEQGLFILDPNYQRACYLEGIVAETTTGTPIPNAKIKLLSNGFEKSAKLNGIYKTGTVTEGTHTVQVSAPGYTSKEITVQLQRGIVTNLNVELSPSSSGISTSKNAFAKVYPTISDGEIYIETDINNKVQSKIISLDGRVLKEFDLVEKKTRISFSELPAGTYIVQLLEQGELVYSEKVIKK